MKQFKFLNGTALLLFVVLSPALAKANSQVTSETVSTMLQRQHLDISLHEVGSQQLDCSKNQHQDGCRHLQHGLEKEEVDETPKQSLAGPNRELEENAPCNGTSFVFSVLTDIFPGETSWELVDKYSKEVASGARGVFQAKETTYEVELCLDPSLEPFKFTIADSFGDGICCGYGLGSYTLKYNDVVIHEGGEFDELEATDVSDIATIRISNLTTWTAADSPVRITGVVVIENGGVLVIREGVEVFFQDSFSGIQNVGGTLSILGQSSNRVVLKPEGDYYWKGISFRAQALPGSFMEDQATTEFSFIDGSVIQYASIMFAGSSSSAALNFRSGPAPFLQRVDLVECVGPSGYSVYVEELQGIFVSRNVRFVPNTTDSPFHPNNAFIIRGSSTSNGIAVLENLVQATDVTHYGLDISLISRLILQDSAIQGFVSLSSIREVVCSRNAVVASASGTVLSASSLGDTSSPFSQLFQDNVITAFPGSTSNALYASNWHETSNTSAITSNTFINGGLEFHVDFSSYQAALLLSNNTVRDSQYRGIYLEGGSFRGRILITDNVIEHCTSDFYSVVTLDVNSANELHFLRNRISHCIGIQLFWLDGANDHENQVYMLQENIVEDSRAWNEMIFFDTYQFTSFQRNVFDNCTAPVSVRLDGSSFVSTSGLVPLPTNYWGNFQDDITGPRSTVRDGLTSAVTSVIDFESVFVTPSLESAVEEVGLPGLFLDEDGSIGGYLTRGSHKLVAGNFFGALSIYITGNASLVLDPGVTISFAPGTAMYVKDAGQVSFTGTQELPIVLQASNSSEWRGLVFDAATPLSMAHVLISGADTGIRHVGPNTLEAISLTISGSTSSCIHSSNARSNWNNGNSWLTIVNSLLSDCGLDSLDVDRRLSVSISNCTILQGGGIHLGSTITHLSLLESTIQDTANYALEIDSYNSMDIHAHNNKISRTNGGFYIRCDCQANFTGNVFEGGSILRRNYAFYTRTSPSPGLHIEGNVLKDWLISSSYAAMHVYFRRSYGSDSGLDMSANHFFNITAGNILELDFGSTERSTNIQSVFGSNLLATSTSNPALFVIQNWPNYPLPSLIGNVFTTELPSDGTEMYYVQVRESASSVGEIDASESYWGSGDVVDIVRHIYDGRDDIRYSTIVYNPFLSSLSGLLMNATLPFLRSGNILGGTLEEGEILTLTRGNYSSDGSLVLDGTLVLEPGVVIKMDEGASLTVGQGGKVVARGTVAAPILFERKSSEGGNWGQINLARTSQDIEFENVYISGAGTSFEPALEIQGGGVLTNLTIQDCMSVGISVYTSGENLLFDGLQIIDTGNSYGVYLWGAGTVVIRNAFLSSGGSSEIYATGSSHLFLESVELEPKSRNSQGLYLLNKFTDVQRLAYSSALVNTTGWRSGRPVTVRSNYRQAQFSLRNSVIDFGYLRDADVVHVDSFYNDLTVNLTDNVFVGAFAQRIIDVVDSMLVSVVRNLFTTSECTMDCLAFNSAGLEFSRNTLRQLHVHDSNSLVSIDSSNPSLTWNRFEDCSGYSALGITHAPPNPGFESNAVVGNVSSVEYFVVTNTTFRNLAGGIYSLDANFWGTTDFTVIRAKTHDASQNASLVSILYTRIFVSEDLDVSVASPPAGSIVDEETMSIGGLMNEGLVVRVPAGLYYAASSIILNHPEAKMVFNAGVRIMFRRMATIHVRQGTLQVLGNSTSPVVLAPTSLFLAEYDGDLSISGSDEWGGIWFGPDANSTILQYSEFYVDGSILKHCQIVSAGYGGVIDAAVVMDSSTILMDNVVVDGSGSDGASIIGGVVSSFGMVLKDVQIVGSLRYGLHTKSFTESLTLKSLNITGSGSHGVYLYAHGDIQIARSYFASNSGGSQIYSSYGKGDFDILSSNLSTASGSIGLSIYYTSSPGLDIGISNVDFTNLESALYINQVWSYANDKIKVTSSTFDSNTCTSTGCKTIEIYSYSTVVFEGNKITNNIAESIMHFNSYTTTPHPSVGIFRNIIRSNGAASSTSGDNAVLLLGSNGPSSFQVEGNEFANPATPSFEISTFSFSGIHPSEMAVNGTNNLFGFASDLTEALIDAKIWDDEEDQSLPEFNFVPFLPWDYEVDCGGDCSGVGSCIFPGYCVCELEWGGETCDTPTCHGLDFCNGRGTCIGLNDCKCDEGWVGDSCSVAECTARNNCNGKGVCFVPNVCSCDIGYEGSDCGDCVNNFRRVGNSCVECPTCRNDGVCDPLAPICVCPSNFGGEVCERCADGFFGPACLPFQIGSQPSSPPSASPTSSPTSTPTTATTFRPTIPPSHFPSSSPSCFRGKFTDACLPLLYLDALLPSAGSVVGGYVVRVQGHNMADENIFCNFGPDLVVAGISISESEVSCVAPSATLTDAVNGRQVVDFSLTIDGENSLNSLPFQFYGACPPTACVNGFCSGGSCFCNSGFTGSACDEQILPPAIDAITNQEVVAGQVLEIDATASSGSLPMRWSVMSSPYESNLSVNATTGSIRLQPSEPTTLLVQAVAENQAFQTTVSFEVVVLPAYLVQVTAISKSVIVTGEPESFVIIDGRCVDRVTTDPVAFCDAEIFVEKDGFRRLLSAVGGPDGVVSTAFVPYPNEGGLYSVGGQVPGFREDTVMETFTVYGLYVSPTLVKAEALTLEAVVVNVTVTSLNTDFPLTLGGALASSLSSGISNVEFSFEHMELNETVPSTTLTIDVSSDSSLPLSTLVDYMISTGTPATTTGKLQVSFEAPEASLLVTPSSVHLRANRGRRSKTSVLISNNGAVPSGQLQVVLPLDFPLLRLSSQMFIPPLQQGETSTIEFESIPDTSEPFRVWTGNLQVVSTGPESGIVMDFQLEVTSDEFGSIRVLVEDEYTFYAEGAPKVAGALIRLTNLVTNDFVVQTSDAEGTAIFSQIPYGSYELYSTTTNHSEYVEVLTLENPRELLVYAFLSRQLVSYTWSVTPTFVEDKYEVTVESTFTAYVPAPVIVIDPTQINLSVLRPGIDQINFKITNYGFVAVNNFAFELPSADGLEFVPIFEGPVGDVPANSTVYYPVKVEAASAIRQLQHFEAAHRNLGGSCTSGFAIWSVECRDTEWHSTKIGYIILNHQCGQGAVLTPTGFSLVNSHSRCCYHGTPSRGSTPQVACECQISIFECIESFLNLPSGYNCIASTLSCANKFSDAGASDLSKLHCTAQAMRPCAGLSTPPPITAMKCALSLAEHCFNLFDSPLRRNLAVELEDRIAAQNFLVSSEAINKTLTVAYYMYGDYRDWNHLTEDQLSVLEQRLDAVVLKTSESEEMISTAELATMIAPPLEEFAGIIAIFAERWNRSLDYYTRGIFTVAEVPDGENTDMVDLRYLKSLYSFIQDATIDAQLRGHEDISARWLADRDAVIIASNRARDGVCAKVRVQINQDAILTREAFEAQLQIENDAGEITNIMVSIEIKARTSGEVATDKFVFGAPDMVGITGVGGMGTLAASTSGSATWLFLALGDAAPSAPVEYEVSGVLSFVTGGVPTTVNLLPATILVSPDPQLHLLYFHEYEIYGDDPFTAEIEPAVPYKLAVMVNNVGYGGANGFRIQSAQPKIIENDKGLLVDFQIISAEVAGQPAEPTLLVDFGEVPAKSSSIGMWTLTSSLQGFFSDFNATFTYKGPINDDRLALVKSIEIFELTHVVSIADEAASRGGGVSDELPDFLVNRLLDIDRLPDTLVSSDNATHHPVFVSLNGTVAISESVAGESYNWRVVVQQDLPNVPAPVASPYGDWYYYRFDDPMPSSYVLDAVIHIDTGTELLMDTNVWRTAKTKRFVGVGPVEERFMHILDFASASGEFELRYRSLGALTGLRATVVSDNSVTLSWTKPESIAYHNILQKYTSQPDSTYTLVANNVQVTQFVAFNLAAGTAYTFRVRGAAELGQYPLTGVEISVVTTGTPAQSCGNGVVEAELGENCDDGNTLDGDCCSSTCLFEAAGTVCRAPSGPCDVADTCDGSSSVCGVNQLQPQGFVCGFSSVGNCSLSCSGLLTTCPVDCPASTPAPISTKGLGSFVVEYAGLTEAGFGASFEDNEVTILFTVSPGFAKETTLLLNDCITPISANLMNATASEQGSGTEGNLTKYEVELTLNLPVIGALRTDENDDALWNGIDSTSNILTFCVRVDLMSATDLLLGDNDTSKTSLKYDMVVLEVLIDFSVDVPAITDVSAASKELEQVFVNPEVYGVTGCHCDANTRDCYDDINPAAPLRRSDKLNICFRVAAAGISVDAVTAFSVTQEILSFDVISAGTDFYTESYLESVAIFSARLPSVFFNNVDASLAVLSVVGLSFDQRGRHLLSRATTSDEIEGSSRRKLQGPTPDAASNGPNPAVLIEVSGLVLTDGSSLQDTVETADDTGRKSLDSYVLIGLMFGVTFVVILAFLVRRHLRGASTTMKLPSSTQYAMNPDVSDRFRNDASS